MNLGQLTLGAAVLVAIALTLYGLHRLAVHLEDRGLLYYREKAQGGGGNPLMDLDKLTRPSIQHVVEVKDAIQESQSIDGD